LGLALAQLAQFQRRDTVSILTIVHRVLLSFSPIRILRFRQELAIRYRQMVLAHLMHNRAIASIQQPMTKQ